LLTRNAFKPSDKTRIPESRSTIVSWRQPGGRGFFEVVFEITGFLTVFKGNGRLDLPGLEFGRVVILAGVISLQAGLEVFSQPV